MIPEDDRGFTLGDGRFETLLAKGGRPLLFEAHLARMAAGAAALGLPAPDVGLARRLTDASLVNAPPRAAVRLSYSAGSGGRGLDRPAEPQPRLIVSVHAAPPAAGPATLATATVRRNAASPTSRHKTLSYLDSVAARREARIAGAEEALLLDTQGRVACAAAANLFWMAGGRLETPSLACGVLAGVIRGQVLAAAARLGVAAAEVEARPERLKAARGLFLTNSLVGVRPVEVLDGAPIAPDTLVARLADAVADVC